MDTLPGRPTNSEKGRMYVSYLHSPHVKEILPSKRCFFSAPLGTVLIPGTTQLTQKDILYRLQSSKAKCIITNEAVAPAVDAVAPECENLHSKLVVSQNSREGWGHLTGLMR